MRKLSIFTILAAMLFIVSCSGGSEPQPVIVAGIFSDQPADGDIAFDPVQQSFTVTNGPETLFFGIDDLDPNLPEYRAFLDFPLDGSTGEEVIPINAHIVSAYLEVFINEVSFAPVVPVLLDLVIYPVSGLRVEDYDSLPIISQALDFFSSDPGSVISINVTPLMREAQQLGLSDFQVRFVLDFDTDVGFVGIEDHPAIAVSAPLLIVNYVP